MKKEINSKSRRKWIMGGLAAFASVALLTTGFAVWVVGVSNTDTNKDVTVKVDTAKNNSISFEMEIIGSNEINLAESKTTAKANQDSTKLVHIDDYTDDGDTYEESPLQLQVKYTIQYGKDYVFDFNKIDFLIRTDAGKDYSTNIVPTNGFSLGHDNGVEKFKRTSEENLTYIEAPNSIETLKAATLDSNTNLYKIEETTTIDFKWGTFFGEKASPATYYNDTLDLTDVSLQNKNLLASEITNELNTMGQNMKKISLNAKLAKK